MASTRFLDDTGISRFDLAREDGMWGVDTMTDVSLPDLSHEDRVAFESAQFCSRRWEEYDGECSTMVCRVDDAQELADMLKGVFDRQQPVPAIADDKEAAFDFIDRKSFSSSCRDSHQMHFQSENVHSTKQQHAQLNLPVQNAKLRLQHSDEMVGVASSTVSDNLTVLPAPFDVVPAENQNERRISNCRSLFDGPADIRQEQFNSIPCMFSHGGNTDEVCKVQFPSHCESEATDRKNMPMASDDQSYDEVSCCNMYKTFESVAMNARSVSTGSVPGGLNDDYSLCSISGGITGMSSPTRNRARKELLPSMQIVSTELPEAAVFGVVGDGDKLLNEHKAANHPHAETLSFENINTQCRLIYPDRNCIRDVVAGGDASNKDCIAPILDESLLSAEGQMKQMQREALYAAAAMQPIDWTGLLAMSVGARPKRRNVRISHDPQTASARKRRERISDRIRVLQRMVPGGTKMDTASMLDEAIHYLKYLKSQIQALEYLEKRTSRPSLSTRSVPFAPCLFSNLNISNLQPSPSSTLIS